MSKDRDVQVAVDGAWLYLVPETAFQGIKAQLEAASTVSKTLVGTDGMVEESLAQKYTRLIGDAERANDTKSAEIIRQKLAALGSGKPGPVITVEERANAEPPTAAPEPPPATPVPEGEGTMAGSEPVKATNAGMAHASEMGVDLREVTPRNPASGITKGDVQSYIKAERSKAENAARNAETG